MRTITAMLAACFLLAAAELCWADGCFVWNKGADLSEPSQKAIIHWHEGTETMVLQVRYEGPAEDFAWIVPVPNRPKVEAIDADKSPFAEVSLYTQRRGRWGYRGREGQGVDAKVEVLERKIVGVYDVAVLAAKDPVALGKWLSRNGYAFPADRKDVLAHYTKKRWVYVAMRIDRKALGTDQVKKLKTGELQPIRFVFETKELVYPLRISSVNRGQTDVLLYLLAAAPMVLQSGPARPGFDIARNMPTFASAHYTDREYATFRKAQGNELPLTWEALGLKASSVWHLCKYRGMYKAKEMSDDLTFAPFEPLAYWQEVLKRPETFRGWHLPLDQLTFLAHRDEDKYGSLLAETLEKLAASKEVRHKYLAARNPLAPPELLDGLAKDNNQTLQELVARNPRASGATLRRLGNSHSRTIRCSVAANPSTPQDVLLKLLEDDWDRVVWKAVRNANVPVAALREKLKTSSANLREFVAMHEQAPPGILAELAKDVNDQVRAWTGVNPRTPADVLALLAEDPSWHVRRCVAANRAAPLNLLTALADDDSAEVRPYVAANPRTPESVLIELASDKDVHVRENVARNPTVPPELLFALAFDPAAQVRQRVVPGATTTPQVLANLLRYSRVDVRRFVALHPETPAPVLQRLARDGDILVRLRVALNPNAPPAVLEKLARDGNPQVAAAAGRRGS